jgi:hypothetical protein
MFRNSQELFKNSQEFSGILIIIGIRMKYNVLSRSSHEYQEVLGNLGNSNEFSGIFRKSMELH